MKKKEIDRREHLHKPTEDLTELYKELCVIFFEYYNAFSQRLTSTPAPTPAPSATHMKTFVSAAQAPTAASAEEPTN